MNKWGQAPFIHGRRPWARMVDKTVRKGTSLVPEWFFSGASGVPPQPQRGERPPTPEGADGQNTTHDRPPNHHRQGG
jgi:hypothetical protein